jgi:dUTP pyrophosphatase
MSSVRIDCLNDNNLEEMYNGIKQKAGDAGYDLIVPERLVVPAGARAFTIDHKVRCAAEGSYFLVPRSSISKTPLRMANSIGIIDVGYRGNLMAKVDNLSDEDYIIESGVRLFQICLPSLITPVVTFGTVSVDTDRGIGGFGSTN